MSYSQDGLQFDFTQVVKGTYQFANFTRGKIERYLTKQCFELENYMKSRHPWENRTGLAEQTLSANYYEENGRTGNEKIPITLGIKLEHGVYYGVYLELAMEQRFAILEPTARLKGPDVFKGMKGLLDRLG